MYVNVDYRVKEIARNFAQLAQYVVLEEITFAEDVNESITLFAENLGVTNLDALDQKSIEGGDEPKVLYDLPLFKDESPLVCFGEQSQYKGDFPHLGMALNSKSMTETCSLELTETLEREYVGTDGCPEWFRSNNKKELFYNYLSDGNLSHAWFTLNSNGWLFEDVKPALVKLAKQANNADFEFLVEAWNSLKHDKYKLGY